MIHRLSAPESAALGCTHVVEVPTPLGFPEPEFIWDCEDQIWVKNEDAGLPRTTTWFSALARPATPKELSNAD